MTDPPTSSYTPVTEGSGVRPTGYHAPRVEFTGECPRYSPANSTFGTRATVARPKILYLALFRHDERDPTPITLSIRGWPARRESARSPIGIHGAGPWPWS